MQLKAGARAPSPASFSVLQIYAPFKTQNKRHLRIMDVLMAELVMLFDSRITFH